MALPNSPQEYLRVLRPADVVPQELFAQLLAGDPEREQRVGKELDWVLAQRAANIEFSLDPVTAFSVANAIQIALSADSPPPASRDYLRELDREIEAKIAVECPALARLLNDCRRHFIATEGRE